MTNELEDPRKTELRERAEQAADAAGYAVDPTRPTVPYPEGSTLKGGMRPDVMTAGTDSVRRLLFVRVEGGKPLPGWLANHVRASMKLERTEIYVVVERAGDQLVSTCRGVGCGLLILREDNTLEKVLDYNPPDDSAAKRTFNNRLKQARRRLDTKLRLNLTNLDESFKESYTVTAHMEKKARDGYLDSIETAMVSWRTWGDEMSERLDAVGASGNLDELIAIEREISRGEPPAIVLG